MRLDGVDPVAIGADWRLRIPACDRLAVNARHEFLFHGFVALGAGQRHVKLCNRRLGIARRQDLVRAVAIGTNRSLIRTRRYSAAVDTLFVREELLVGVSAGLHHKLLAVATSTSG